MKRLVLFVFSLSAIGVLTLPSSQAQRQPPSPEPIRQTFVASIGDNPHTEKTIISLSDGTDVTTLKIGAVTLKVADVQDELAVTGIDKRGRPWTVYEPTERGVGYSALWTAALDGDGVQDLIFFDYSWVSGRCTDMALVTTILFDSDGAPSPARFGGFYNGDLDFDHHTGKGILDLGNWGGNGRAELIQKDCYNYSYQNARSDVYGLTDVYEAQNGLWKRLTKQQIALHQSTYNAVAKRGGRKLVSRPKDLDPVPDYSNDRTGGVPNRIVDFVDADCGTLPQKEGPENILVERGLVQKEKRYCQPHFDLADGQSCFATPDIVLSTPRETLAVLEGTGGILGPDGQPWQRWKQLLGKIIDEKLDIQLTGQIAAENCSPTMIWATQPQ